MARWQQLPIKSGNNTCNSGGMNYKHILHKGSVQILLNTKQGKSEGFDSCDRPSNLAQMWSKSSIFQPVWPWNVMFDLEKQ